ncbi:uncharacterized protein LOC143904586 [Temnothorax americanus]|uniref:uncharacterized protein LOC143904586 n=1 Tax=Temnothorax americanus TaxID=1964332 RepID=UPI004067B067
MALKWLKVCKTQDTKGRICSVHFEPSCFTKSLQQQLLGYSPRKSRKLRNDAMSTLHLFHNVQVEKTPLLDNSEKTTVALLHVDDVPNAMTNTSMSTVNKSEEPINASTHINDSTDVIDAVVSTNVVDPVKLKKLQWELAVLKKKFNIYKKKKEVDLVAMKKKMQQFKRNQSFEADKKYETKMYDVLKKVFTPGQIRMLLNPFQKYVNWSSEDIASAMSLRCVSPKAYRYLKNVMKIPLPSLQTLRRWATDINVEPGVLNAILDCMRFKSKSIPDFETLQWLY